MEFILLLVFFLFLSALVVFQDFKTRLIDLWLLILYSFVLILIFYLKGHGYSEMLENLIFISFYLLVLFLVLHLYYYFKVGSIVRILDKKIGLADVWILASMGLTLDFLSFLLISNISFGFSILYHLISRSRQKINIPLAGISVLVYALYSLTLWISL